MKNVLKNMFLSNCPVCGNGVYPQTANTNTVTVCKNCNSKLVVDKKSGYIARFVFYFMIFVCSGLILTYYRSSIVFISIVFFAFFFYFKIITLIDISGSWRETETNGVRH